MSRGSMAASATTDRAISTITPSENGSGMMALTARSMSASACAMSRPVGWRPK